MTLPPVAGLILFTLLIQYLYPVGSLLATINELFQELPFFLGTALLVTAIPSFLTFLSFEFVFSKTLKSSKGYIFVGALYGYFSGVFVFYAVSGKLWFIDYLSFIGLLVGALLGFILHALYRRPARS